MLIIFGLRVVFFTLGTGTFHCPNEGGDRQYRRRQGRRFFTLFFIPVIPLNKVGPEIVECSSCRTRYHLAVLGTPTTADLAALPSRLLRLAISQVLRSGDYTNVTSRQRAAALVHAAGDPAYTDEVLSADLSRPFDEVRAEMSRAAGALAPQAREGFLAEAARIAVSDGPLTVSERETLRAVGQDLGLTELQIAALVEQAEKSTTE